MSIRLFTLLLVVVPTGAISVEERLRSLEEGMQKISKENAVMRRENAEIKAELHRVQDGELRIFHADACPEGWVEFNRTQGFMLTGRPKNGTTGMTYNRPFDAGEAGRMPSHSHEATVVDPGHNHDMALHDPGHTHSYKWMGTQTSVKHDGYDSAAAATTGTTTKSVTGITVDSLPAKSSVSVSINANEAGEHFPLVYILVCQRAA